MDGYTLVKDTHFEIKDAEVNEKHSWPIQKHQSLSLQAEHLLLCLIAACRSILSEPKDFHIFSSASNILETLKSGNSWNALAEFHNHTIESI